MPPNQPIPGTNPTASPAAPATYSPRIYTFTAIGTIALASIVAIGGYILGHKAGYNSSQNNIRKTPIVERLETFTDGTDIYLGIKRLDGTVEGARTQDGRVWRTYSGIQKKALEWDEKAGRYFEQQIEVKSEVLRPVYPNSSPITPVPSNQPIEPSFQPIEPSIQQPRSSRNIGSLYTPEKKAYSAAAGKISYATQSNLEEIAEIEFIPAKQPRQIIIIK